MKASEVVRKLNALIELFGDQDVEVNQCDGSGSCIATEINEWAGQWSLK